MAKKFSRKEYENMLDEQENEMFFAGEEWQNRNEKNKQNPFPMPLALYKFIGLLKNFENKTGQTLPSFFKNVRDKQENECELVLKSMDAYAEKNGLIKPMDKDEFAGFYLWLSNQDEFIDNNPDRSHYIDFHNHMKQEIEAKSIDKHPLLIKEWESFIEPLVMNSFLEVEKKATTGSLKFESAIRCAAFCEMIYYGKELSGKPFMIQTKTPVKTMVDFARLRYNEKIKPSLNGGPKQVSRLEHQKFTKNGLPPLKKCF